jgi:hypothetical protein
MAELEWYYEAEAEEFAWRLRLGLWEGASPWSGLGTATTVALQKASL